MVKLLVSVIGVVIFWKIILFCVFAYCVHMMGYF
jgi:hypothetical protein